MDGWTIQNTSWWVWSWSVAFWLGMKEKVGRKQRHQFNTTTSKPCVCGKICHGCKIHQVRMGVSPPIVTSYYKEHDCRYPDLSKASDGWLRRQSHCSRHQWPDIVLVAETTMQVVLLGMTVQWEESLDEVFESLTGEAGEVSNCCSLT